jgi:SMC interacting uncharacterized protein involved in chromosome segregation
MKREFLEKLELEKDVIDQIMAEHGKDIEGFKSQVETLKTSESGLKAQIAERDKDISDLKKASGDSDELKARYEELQSKYKADTKSLTEKVQDAQLTAAIKVAVAATAHDPDIVTAQIDKTKITLNDDGSVKMGLDEQVKSLQESKAFLFKDGDGGKPSGGEPGPTGDNPDPGTGPTAADLNAAYGIPAAAQ